MGGRARFVLSFIVFPALLSFAWYSIFWFARHNGLRELVKALVKERSLPESSGILRTRYTGVQSIDRTLAVLTVFFWPTTDGSAPSLSLHTFVFAGAFGSAWALILLESWRQGNARTLPAIASIFGLVAQLFTFAISASLYCGLHLWFSPVSVQPKPERIVAPETVVRVLPFIFVVGYIIPCVGVILPTPGVISVDAKQVLIALWQPFPGYVSLLAFVAHLLLPHRYSSSISKRIALRIFYSASFWLAAITHAVGWGVALTSVLLPALFNEKIVHALHPREVFGVTWPSSDFRVTSLAEGVHVFLQWDFLIGCHAVLLWAAVQNALAQRRITGRVNWFGLATTVVGCETLFGPVAAAVHLMRLRDELLLQPVVRKEIRSRLNKRSSEVVARRR